VPRLRPRRGGPALAAALLLACGGRAATPVGDPRGPRGAMTPKDIVAQSSPAIVRIEAGDSAGTGFVVDGTGLIATNLHVVVGRKEITVKLLGGEVFPVMQVAGVDAPRDLALLRIAPPKRLPAVRLGDSGKLVAGDQVVAIGNPLGVFTYSVSSGLISQVRPVCTQQQVEIHQQNRPRYEALAGKLEAFSRCQAARGSCDAIKPTPAEVEELETLRCRDELTVLQISAPISQGSSGGPLFNQYGEVVGITTAIIQGGQNINLAIPANYVKPLVASPAALSMEEFAQRTRALAEREAPDDGIRIQRLVPDHAASIFDACRREAIEEMVSAIEQAIDVGAPLYNKGEIEACFRIYEGTAVKYERDRACPGVRAAFIDGLERAKTLDSYKEKAWAMRDTFDGLLIAARRWAQRGGAGGAAGAAPGDGPGSRSK
jgi:S1-C subfamily serine protease